MINQNEAINQAEETATMIIESGMGKFLSGLRKATLMVIASRLQINAIGTKSQLIEGILQEVISYT